MMQCYIRQICGNNDGDKIHFRLTYRDWETEETSKANEGSGIIEGDFFEI